MLLCKTYQRPEVVGDEPMQHTLVFKHSTSLDNEEFLRYMRKHATTLTINWYEGPAEEIIFLVGARGVIVQRIVVSCPSTDWFEFLGKVRLSFPQVTRQSLIAEERRTGDLPVGASV